jgi:uncharacterized protein YxjI
VIHACVVVANGRTRLHGIGDQAVVDEVDLGDVRGALVELMAAPSRLNSRDAAVKKLAEMQQKISELATVEDDLTQARKEVAELQAEVNDKQQKVDTQVDRAAEIAGQLHEKESFLEIANERRAQLEKQVAQARLLLKQSGLSLDSLPKDRVPTVDGVVTAVADNSIEVSLGGDDGLQTGHQIEVYRNDEYLGRAIVKSVKPDRSIAVIVREYARGIIQRGDKVTTRLKA